MTTRNADRSSLVAPVFLLVAVFLSGFACTSGQVASGDDTAGESGAVYARKPPSNGGTGKVYMGREIARTMSYHGIPWLEREDREETEQPDAVVDAMGLESDDVVADLGAGSGYFSFRIAQRVPAGKVLAVDIQPEMLEAIAAKAASTDVTNVEPVLGSLEDPNLPAGEVDAVLMVDAYHEFSHPREMMRAIVQSLTDGGRVFLVEYRDDPDSSIHPLHRMTEAQVRREMEAVGLEWVRTMDFLPEQDLLVFRRGAR